MAHHRPVPWPGTGAARTFLPPVLALLLLSAGCLAPGEGGGTPPLVVSSAAFGNGEPIAVQYTCDGGGISPPLSWGEVPAGTRSIALLVTDPDAPGRIFTHWVVFNLPPETRDLPPGEPGREILPGGTNQGMNDAGRAGYTGPCPPGGMVHHYHFTVTALDATLDPSAIVDGKALGDAMAGHVLARGEIVGTYQRA